MHSSFVVFMPKYHIPILLLLAFMVCASCDRSVLSLTGRLDCVDDPDAFTLTFTSMETGEQQTVSVNEAGEFRIEDYEEGEYEMEAVQRHGSYESVRLNVEVSLPEDFESGSIDMVQAEGVSQPRYFLLNGQAFARFRAPLNSDFCYIPEVINVYVLDNDSSELTTEDLIYSDDRGADSLTVELLSDEQFVVVESRRGADIVTRSLPLELVAESSVESPDVQLVMNQVSEFQAVPGEFRWFSVDLFEGGIYKVEWRDALAQNSGKGTLVSVYRADGTTPYFENKEVASPLGVPYVIKARATEALRIKVEREQFTEEVPISLSVSEFSGYDPHRWNYTTYLRLGDMHHNNISLQGGRYELSVTSDQDENGSKALVMVSLYAKDDPNPLIYRGLAGSVTAGPQVFSFEDIAPKDYTVVLVSSHWGEESTVHVSLEKK